MKKVEAKCRLWVDKGQLLAAPQGSEGVPLQSLHPCDASGDRGHDLPFAVHGRRSAWSMRFYHPAVPVSNRYGENVLLNIATASGSRSMDRNPSIDKQCCPSHE
jgi:hypothetical protein